MSTPLKKGDTIIVVEWWAGPGGASRIVRAVVAEDAAVEFGDFVWMHDDGRQYPHRNWGRYADEGDSWARGDDEETVAALDAACRLADK